MNAMKKSAVTIIAVTVCIFLIPFLAYATGGSLLVELKSGGTSFNDYTISIWRVADISENSVKPVVDFSRANVDWNTNYILAKNNNIMAEKLLDFALNTGSIKPRQIRTTTASGITQFDDLEDGLYLVSMRDNAVPARYIFTPFVVPMPYDGQHFVTAGPKGERADPPVTVTTRRVVTSPPATAPKTPPTKDNRPPDVPLINVPDPKVPMTNIPNVPQVPQTNRNNVPSTEEPLIYVPDPEVPLASLPETGLLLLTFPWVISLVFLLLSFRRNSKQKKKKES